MVRPYRYGMQTLWRHRDRNRDWIRRPRRTPNRNQKETLHLRASLNSNSVREAKSQGLGGEVAASSAAAAGNSARDREGFSPVTT